MENNLAFVLLAGGKSERMGKPKGLLHFKDTFWLLEQLHKIAKTGISKVYIGLGFNAEMYFNEIPWLKKSLKNEIFYKNLLVKSIINTNPELESFSTLQTVLKKIPSTAIVLNHIDIPVINANEFQKIVKTENTVVVPSYKNKKGHPVLLNASFCAILKEIPAESKEARLDIQIKKLPSFNVSVIEVTDPSVITNLNTPEDWKNYVKENS